MALNRLIVLLLGAALPLLFFSRSEAAGEVGVSFGRVANDLPDSASVAQLLKQNGVTMVRIYDTNPKVLTSLANTGIKVTVMMPNENLAAAATNPSYAFDWVRSQVAAYYPATQIRGIAVGNEVFDDPRTDKMQLVPAMANVQKALEQLRLADAVKVSTPVAFSAVKDSFPPSKGRFRDDIAQSVMQPMMDFLRRTGSYLSVNVYPCLTQMMQPDEITLDYALGNSNPGVPADGNIYTSLLDAQLDATYYAMEDLGFGTVSLHVTETGCPSHGRIIRRRPPAGGGTRRLLEAGDGGPAASIANAQAYNNNIINRVLSRRTGTPHRPDADMDVYIFALFNENQKSGDPDDVERNFGLFYPNMTKVYEFNFHGTGAPPGPPTPSWCVANAAAGDARLKDALDFACGHGADCSAIQPDGSCFEPDTMVAHASYAFNSYYQRMSRATGSCYFEGAASIVYQAPADTCSSAKPSWCALKPGVGDAQLQAALDYACGNGADCRAIRSGGACFQPDTKVAHASYAVNDYYQRKDRASGTCDFNGAASVVYQQPSGICDATAISWCVAKPGVGDAQLQTALDYACSNGAACSAIQPGGACFQPDTKASHASYAFNSYYQRNGRASVACDFSGAGSVVYQQPKVGNCVLPSNG